MRLVRCPACQTVFRLQPEQLRAHGGRVRCGHCFTLFDAREHFVDTGATRHSAPAESGMTPSAPASEQTPGEGLHPPGETLFVLEDPGPDLPPPPTTPWPTKLDEEHAPPSAHDSAGAVDPHAVVGIDPLDFGVPNDFHGRSLREPQPTVGPAPEPSYLPGPPLSLIRQRRAGPAPSPTASPDGDPTDPSTEHRTGPPPTAYWPSLDEPEPEIRRSASETRAEAAEREAIERARRMRERMNSIVVQDRGDDDGRVEPRFNPDARTTAELAAEPQPTQADSAGSDDGDQGDEDETATGGAERITEDDDDASLDDRASRYAPVEAPPANAASRWLQGLAIGVLLGLLGAQSVYLFRDEITRQWPELRAPYLQACARLGCELPLPRDANLIDIETSDLEIEPANPSHYTLNAVVRNRAHFPQQHPHLELTLTDSRDRPVVRRVVSPQEWLANKEALATGLSPASSQPVRLSFETSGVANAVGYRIYAFFP